MRDLDAWRTQFDKTSVNGLPLPPLLLELMEQGVWLHPGDNFFRGLIPFLRDPVVFLSVEHIALESQGFLADRETSSFFHEFRGSQGTDRPLPWLDVDRALFIAVNRRLGDDVGIALDYRSSLTDPRVVASEWDETPALCHWREVSPTFSAFVTALSIKTAGSGE